MKTIYKYPIGSFDSTLLKLPKKHTLLHAGLDPKEQICVWIELDTDDLPSLYKQLKVSLVGTGCPIPKDTPEYFNTFLDGSFVWHVYTGLTSNV